VPTPTGRAVARDEGVPRTIAFERRKHGRYLLTDAAAAASLPHFIASAETHRLTFFEIALIEGSRGHVELDGEPLELRPGRVIVTAPGEARRWRLGEPRLHAQLAFFEADALDEPLRGRAVVDAFPCLGAPRAGRAATLPPASFGRLSALVADMRGELAQPRHDSHRVVEAQLYHLLHLLQRHVGQQQDRCSAIQSTSGASREVAQLFARLVDLHVGRWCGVDQYARALHVSARHLNACVRRATGRTAIRHIHDRLVLEAQRELLGSRRPVAAIADTLGFCDASYFARFFKRQTGATPAAFRRDRGSPIVHRESD
jgi:AraC family transcriptional regulator, transcriptional activator of pobA